MKLKSLAFWAALAAMSAPSVVAAKDTPKPIALSATDQALVDRAIARGDLLYAYDQAAWHGTDDLQAKVNAASNGEAIAATVGGWIVDGSAAEPVLVFIDKAETPKAVYIARFADGGTRLVEGKLLGPGDDRTISPTRMKLVAALRAARAELTRAKLAGCADRPFNSVVLPPETPGGPTLVYLMTPQTQAKQWPLGGHYLIEVKPDGTIGSTRPFTNSCITVGRGSGGNVPVAMFVSHLLDPVPTEIHVFSMRAAGLPLYVSTTQNKLIWSIERIDGKTRISATDRIK